MSYHVTIRVAISWSSAFDLLISYWQTLSFIHIKFIHSIPSVRIVYLMSKITLLNSISEKINIKWDILNVSSNWLVHQLERLITSSLLLHCYDFVLWQVGLIWIIEIVCPQLKFITHFLFSVWTYRNTEQTFVLHSPHCSAENWSRWPLEGRVRKWGINGRVSPRIFYKLMSMRLHESARAISDYTGSTRHNKTHAGLAVGSSQGKDTRQRGEKDTGWTKKCFRSYVDFLPHCKANPQCTLRYGVAFLSAVRAAFFSLPSLLTRPPRDCIRDTGGVNSGCHE